MCALFDTGVETVSVVVLLNQIAVVQLQGIVKLGVINRRIFDQMLSFGEENIGQLLS